MTRAVLYERSSAGPIGIEDQLRGMKDQLGPDTQVVATFADECHSSIPDRPGLQAALDYLERNSVDLLVVTSADRLTRDKDRLVQIKSRLGDLGVVLISATPILKLGV